jgi:hypothetical protein
MHSRVPAPLSRRSTYPPSRLPNRSFRPSRSSGRRRPRAGATRGVVFFLGGGFLELSGSSRTEASGSIGLWLQVRDVDASGQELKNAGVDIIELPTDKPWGLREMHIRDPDGLSIVIVEVPETHPLRRR